MDDMIAPPKVQSKLRHQSKKESCPRRFHFLHCGRLTRIVHLYSRWLIDIGFDQDFTGKPAFKYVSRKLDSAQDDTKKNDHPAINQCLG